MKTNQPTNQPTNRSTDQPTNQPTNRNFSIINFEKYRLGAALLSIVIVSLMLSSCKKDVLDNQVVVEDLIKDAHIKTLEFIEKAETIGSEKKIKVRDGGYYSSNEAFDLINDALNYNYCRPADEYIRTRVFKDSFNITFNPVNGISEIDLLNLYNAAANKAGEHYYGISDSTKAAFMFDVRQAGNPSGNNLPVYVYFMMTAGTCDTPTSYPYDETDYWSWGVNAGKCDGSYQGYDAADILRCDLRKNKLYKNKTAAYYFTDRYSVCFAPQNNLCGNLEDFDNPIYSDYFVTGSELINPIDLSLHDNLYDYLLFRVKKSFPNYDLCLDPEELSFYYTASLKLVDDYKPQQKIIGSIDYDYDVLLGTNINFHTMRADYYKVNLITGVSNATPLPCIGCNP